MADAPSHPTVADVPVGGGPKPRPIALFLFVLALVALVPAFVFSAILIQRNNEAQERVVEELVVSTARSIVQTVEREIAANITTLKVLASDPTLVANDLRSFHARVTTALEGTGTFVYLLNSDLRTTMSTRGPYTGELGPVSNDPASSQRALETREVQVSDLVLGRVSQVWVVNILQPVFLPGREPMVLGFNRNAGALSGPLLANKMPTGWNVALLDRQGLVIASSDAESASGEMFDIASLEQLSAAPGWRTIDVGGQDFVAAVQSSALTGWSLVSWAPADVVSRPLADAFWSLLVGGILLAAAVILVIYWVSLQIGRSVHGLEDDARKLGKGEAVTAHDYPISEIATVSTALAAASAERKTAERDVRLLMREVAHRSKNQMTVIAAMAKQTAKGADNVPEFVQGFERRIFGLARSTDLLLAHGAAGVDLRELLTLQLDPFWPEDTSRVTLDGPPVRLNAQAAQILGMAAHELGTNAVRHGAFAGDVGAVAVTWSKNGALNLSWRETLPQAPVRTGRRGFGTTVLESMVGRSLGAEVVREETANGFEWRFSIPAESVDPMTPPHGPTEVDAPARGSAARIPQPEK